MTVHRLPKTEFDASGVGWAHVDLREDRGFLAVSIQGMRFAVAVLALIGAIVAALALQVHYSTASEVCSINEKWDCGIVNHSPYAVIGRVPVAAIGILGYLALAGAALMRRKALVLIGALAGLGFSLYLTHIEKDVLEVWCVYCVCSLVVICSITLASVGWLLMERAGNKAARAGV